VTSAQAMGHSGRPASARVLPWDQTSPRPARKRQTVPRRLPDTLAPARMPPGDEDEEEFAM
jgi:hypothetical protein